MPTLVIVPVKARVAPGAGAVAGHALVIASLGVGGVLLQVVAAVTAIKATPQTVLAVAVKVSGNGAQGLAGV